MSDPSTSATQVISGMYAAWDDADVERANSYWHDQVNIVANGSSKDTGVPFLGTFTTAKASFDALTSSVHWTTFRCDDYLTTQEDADKVITRGIWGGTVLGKDGRPVPDAKFECKWVDIFCVKNGKIAGVDSFFDTAAIQQAFAAAKGASSAA